eukprot:6087015-Amphidinium_carterae.1
MSHHPQHGNHNKKQQDHEIRHELSKYQAFQHKKKSMNTTTCTTRLGHAIMAPYTGANQKALKASNDVCGKLTTDNHTTNRRRTSNLCTTAKTRTTTGTRQDTNTTTRQCPITRHCREIPSNIIE